MLSSFEKYRKEVASGCLEWGPMHTSELFWRQNLGGFEEKDFQVLRLLLRLIESSREVRPAARPAGRRWGDGWERGLGGMLAAFGCSPDHSPSPPFR